MYKTLSIAFFILIAGCKKDEAAKTYSLNSQAINHTWYYSTAIRNVQSGITSGSSYYFTITNNRLDLYIDGYQSAYYQLKATGTNSVQATHETTGTKSNWTYTVDDTARTLDLCLDSSNCYQFIR